MKRRSFQGLGHKKALLRGASKPPASAVAAEAIPAELRGLPRWVAWRWTKRKGQWTKPPLDPRTGGPAASDDPATWGTFEQALALYQSGRADGIGFMFWPADGFAGVDADDCRDPASGQLAPWAQELLERFATYAEVSPSGTGLKLLLRGRVPGERRRKGTIEMYDAGRYFTVTGHAVPGVPAKVTDGQAALDWLFDELFGTKSATKPSAGPLPAAGLDLDDADLLRRMFAARNGRKVAALWHGDTSGYDSASEADQALANHLAFWCRCDKGRMDSLFRQSKLCRDKWISREDYREATLAKAIAGCRQVYEPSAGTALPPTRNGHAPDKSAPPAAGPPAAGPPPDRDAQAPDDGVVHLTDRGNGIRLVRAFGRDLRHCWPWRKWLVWDGHRWQMDAGDAVARDMKQTLVDLFRWAEARVREIGQRLEESADA